MTNALSKLLFSSRPQWAMMPAFVAENFVESVLFLLSTLEHAGIRYVAHFGTLLGAIRLGGPLPWDEDADIFVIDEDRGALTYKLQHVLRDHGFRLIYDPQDFFWVRQRPWLAGQGHIGLSFLPPILPAGTSRPVNRDDARIAIEELFPLKRVPFGGAPIWGPGDPEAVVQRLYGDSGSPEVMQKFVAPKLSDELVRFWSAAKRDDGLDWPAISARFKARRRELPPRHVFTFPWWWFNGAYNIGIKELRQLGARHAARL